MRLELPDDVRLHLEAMKKLLAGMPGGLSYFNEEGGCGAQCKITCAHYCRAECEAQCKQTCDSTCNDNCLGSAYAMKDLCPEYYAFLT